MQRGEQIIKRREKETGRERQREGGREGERERRTHLPICIS